MKQQFNLERSKDRPGSTLVVVLALLGLLALLGVAFARFALQEDESADYFTDASKNNEDSEPPIEEIFDEVLAQIIMGAYDSEDVNANGILDAGEDINNNGILDRGHTNSAMLGGRHSLLGTMFGRDLAPYSGHGINIVRLNEDRNNNGTLDGGEDLNGNGILDTNVAVVDQAYSSEDANNNGILDPGEDKNGNGLIDMTFVPATQGLMRLADFPGSIYEDFNNNGTLDPGEDLNGNGVLDIRVSLSAFPDPDTGLTYPDINNAFVSYDGYTVTWGRDGAGNPVFGYPVRVIKPSYMQPQLLRQTDADGISRPNIFPGSEWDVSLNTRGMSLRPHPFHSDLTVRGATGLQFRGPRYITQLAEAEGLGIKGPFPFSEYDANGNGNIDSEDANGNGILDPGEDLNGNGILDFGEDTNENGTLDSLGLMGVWGVAPWRANTLYRRGQSIAVLGGDNFPIYFKCIQTGVSGAAGSPPGWDGALGQPAGFQITDNTTTWAYTPRLQPDYQFDADADGDGISDSIYTDLDLRVRERADGKKMIPIPAIKIMDLESLINMVAHGNLAAQWGRGPDGQPGQAGIDDNANGTPDDVGELGWPGTDDTIALNPAPIAGPAGSQFGRGNFLSRSNQGLSSPWQINPQYVLNANPATDRVSGTQPFENLRRFLGQAPGWTPASWVEASNFEYLLSKIGTPIYSGSGQLLDVIPGTYGDPANAVAVFGNAAIVPAPQNYPKPGIPGRDLNGNRYVGEWYSGVYAGDPVAQLHGFRTPLDFASAGTSVVYDNTLNGVGGWRPTFYRPTGQAAPLSNLHRFIRYDNYHTLGTIPIAWGRNGVPGATTDDDGNGVRNFAGNGLPDLLEIGLSDDPEYIRQRSLALFNEPEESIVDPRIAVNEDRNGNGVLNAGEDLNGNGLLENSGELPFEPSEMAFLHLSETDLEVIAQDSRLEKLLPFNLKDGARAKEIRRRLTTLSWALKQRAHTFTVGQGTPPGALDNFRPNEFGLAGRSAVGTARHTFPASNAAAVDAPGNYQPLRYEIHKTLQVTSAARRPDAGLEKINSQRQRSINLNQLLVPSTNSNSSRPFSTWQPGIAYQVGDIVIPPLVNFGGVHGIQRLPYEDTVNPNGILDPGEDTNGNGYLDKGANRFYRCVGAGTSDSSTPLWLAGLGQTITDGSVTWQCIEEQFIYRDLTPHPTRGNLGRGSVSDWKRTNFGTGGDTTPPYIRAIPGGGSYDARAQEWWARFDRQRMARMIYVLLYMHCKGRDSDAPFAANDTRQVLSDQQLREMAQFAVNVVDQLDGDSVITKFEYDKNLANGWNLDDDAFSHADQAPYNPGDADYDANWPEDGPQRGVVFGVEKQELEFSEVLSLVTARAYEDVDGDNNFNDATDNLTDHEGTEWNDERHQYFTWIELRNTSDHPITFGDNNNNGNGEDDNNNGVLDSGEDANFNGRLDYGFQYCIEVVPSNTNAKTGTSIATGVPGDDGVRRLTWAHGRVNPGGLFTIGSVGDGDNRSIPGDSNSDRIRSRLRLDPAWVSGNPTLTQYIPDTTWNPNGNPNILDLLHPSGGLGATTADLTGVNAYRISAGPDPSWSGDLKRYSSGRRVNRIGEWLSHETLNPDPANASENDWNVTLILKRRLNPHRRPPQEVDNAAGNTTTTLPQERDNQWVEIDRVGVQLTYYTQDSDHSLDGTSTLPNVAYSLRKFRPRNAAIDTNAFADDTPGTELLTAITGTAPAQPKQAQFGTASVERNRPLSRELRLGVENGMTNRFNTLGRENQTSTTNFGGTNGFNQWQVQNDRHFASVGELLSIPLYGPRAINLRYANNGKNTAGEVKFLTPDFPDSVFPMLTPTQQQLLDNRWYRLMSFMQVHSKAHTHPGLQREDINGNGVLDADEDRNRNGVLDEQGWFRDPGKLNWNMMRFPEVYAGLIDDSRVFNFSPLASPGQFNYMQDPQNPSRDWWHQFLISRDGFDVVSGIPLPGTIQSRPFRELSFTARGNKSIDDTALRPRPQFPTTSNPNNGDPVQTHQRLLGVGTEAQHFAGASDHHSRNHILSKVIGNTTNISNTFVVFIELSWFEVAEVDNATGVKNVRIGAKLEDMPTHRGMFVIDRSLAMERVTTGCLPSGTAATRTPFAFRNQSEDLNGNGTFDAGEDVNQNGIFDNFDFRDLVIYRQIIR